MTGEGQRRQSSVVAVLLLCSLVHCLSCFSWRGLGERLKQKKEANEATEVGVRTGRILFKGKEFNVKSPADTGNEELLQTDLDQFDGSGSGMSEQESEQEEVLGHEVAWRSLSPLLHCGLNQMKVEAMGHGAAALQLDMGKGRVLPLSQVPPHCGHLLSQNAAELVLVVPYDGCNVIQEGGNYILPMSWRENPVKFTCPLTPDSTAASTAASTSPKPPLEHWQYAFLHGSKNVNRQKRHTISKLMNDPNNQHSYVNYPQPSMNEEYTKWLQENYLYYMYLTTPAPTQDDPSTTTPPETTTENPATVVPHDHPHYHYYPWYSAYPYSYYTYFLPPVTPVSTSTTTTTPSTTGTTTTASTTNTPKTQHPYFFYYPPGQVVETPDGSGNYYYPIIQYFYGMLPSSQTTQAPISTKPGETTSSTAKPTTVSSASTTATASSASPTSASTASSSSPTSASTASSSSPTTASSSSATSPTTTPSTTKACKRTTTPSSSPNTSPDIPTGQSSFVPYDKRPFVPSVSYKAGNILDDWKFMPETDYRPEQEPRAHQYPGFYYFEPGWFQSLGQNDFDWMDFQQEQA